MGNSGRDLAAGKIRAFAKKRRELTT